MIKLYFKNFKGFDEQIVELKDVNFLVGENSTGKTSLINLINVFSNKEFLYDSQFNNSEIEFGYFEEILSKTSVEKFFQLGKEGLAIKEKKAITHRILYQYKSHNSIPKLEWIKIAINNLNIWLKPNTRKYECFYYIKEFKNFDDWIHNFDSNKYKKLNVDIPPGFAPIPVVLQMLSEDVREKTKGDQPRFEFPYSFLYNNYTWLAPIRAKAKRIYESYDIKFSPEGDHIPSLLKLLLSNTKNKDRVKLILEKFGKESNLFDKLEINELGNKNVSPFEIIVKFNDIPIKLPNVGYGVSQILPLIIEILATKGTMFSIQQPEVHLHPKAQSAFGSFLFSAHINDDNRFVIETHSDFTINRFRYCLASNRSKKIVSSQILFFERTTHGNMITSIPIDSKGSYINDLPDAYREFFIDEELKLLEL